MFFNLFPAKKITMMILLGSGLLLAGCSTVAPSENEKDPSEGGSDAAKQNIPSADEQANQVTIDPNFEIPDWTSETHSNDAEPNITEVFDDTAVKRLDIVIAQDKWEDMLDDMTALYGEMGTSQQNTPPNENGAPQERGGPRDAAQPGGFPGAQQGGGPGGGQRQGTEAAGGNDTFADEDPIYVPAEVFYDDKQWYKVGVRFKGNSSLKSSWSSGILKLSFKLNFDKYEDDYPQLDNQRFYGFKKLSLKNNYDDDSLIREKVATDVFKSFGLAAPHTAFYEVYVDHGEGPTYFGVYTLVEEVDDTVIETQFSDDSGNLYKPDGDAATFTADSFNEEEYVKKTNEDEADFSDIQSLLSALHDDTRTTDPESRRRNLDAVFDTDVFLKYLAVNTVVQNWDTYGRMTHNYFIYTSPTTNKLTRIPWDNNEALQFGKRGGSLALDFSTLTTGDWPLIEYLYADATYKAIYDSYLQEVIDGAFDVASMKSLYERYSVLLAPYATRELDGYSFLNDPADFDAAITELTAHVQQQTTAVNEYLGVQ